MNRLLGATAAPSGHLIVRVRSVKRLLVDPHEGPRLVGFAFVFDAAEFVAKLAVLPLVVVVVFGLPDCLKGPRLVELERKNFYFQKLSNKHCSFKKLFKNLNVTYLIPFVGYKPRLTLVNRLKVVLASL